MNERKREEKDVGGWRQEERKILKREKALLRKKRGLIEM